MMQSIALGILVFFGRRLIAEFYTNIEEVIAECDSLFKFFVIFYQFDSIMCI